MPHQAALLPIGHPFIELTTVDSTNNYAMGQVHARAAGHGVAFFAQEQTTGKGQRGKTWSSHAGENIILSVVLQPFQMKVSDSFYLSATIALACYDFFKNYAGNDTCIKWPNDIYWRDRKAGGILIENVVMKEFCTYVIVGIGMNINQTSFASNIVNPVSLKQISGKTFRPIDLAKELCSFLDIYYRKLEFERVEIIEHYNTHLFRLNQIVNLKRKDIVFETLVKGVSPSGKLLTRDTEEREFDFGEVEWIL